jgi:CubicO group peptidase (beta-lactamase class C family)
MTPARPTIAAAFALLAGVARAQSPGDRLDSVFAAHRGTDRPGCAVGVVQEGKPVEFRAFGMADLSHGIAISSKSVFHVASVSKQFTAMALVLLEASGKLSIDDDIRKYLHELPDYGHRITVRHLLNHTSGIRDYFNLLMAAGWRLGDDLITETDALGIVTRQRQLNFVPGTDWIYNNTGFTLAAVIVKRVTGLTLREYADRELFQPLGMSSTHFHDDNSMVVRDRARGYVKRGVEWREMAPNYSTVGATNLFTTVEDLAVWHRQMNSRERPNRAAWSRLLERGVLTNGDTLRYALGIALGTYRGLPTISHAGGDPGYRAHLLHFPSQRFGVSVLCNDDGSNAPRLAELTAEAYLGPTMRPADSIRGAGKADPLAAAVGLYWSDSAEVFGHLRLDGERLVWAGGSAPTGQPLTPIGPDEYRLGRGPVTFRRNTGASGVTLTMVGAQGEKSVFAPVAEWKPTLDELRLLVGRYISDEVGNTLDVRLDRDTLWVERPKSAAVTLTPLFRDAFAAGGTLRIGVVRFQRDAKGKVTELLSGSGRVRRLRFERVPSP